MTLFGSMVLYAFSLYKGAKDSEKFLRGMFPNRSEVFYLRVNFVFVVFVGSIIGTVVFAPQTTQQALGAGSRFTVTGVTPSATLFGVGAGANLSFGAPINLFASYDGYFSGTESLNTFSGGLSLSF